MYPLLAVFDKNVREASSLDLFEHGIGVCLDRERAELDAVILLLCGRRFRRSRIKQLLHIGAEGVHALAVLREPVHHIAVIAGNAELVTLRVADERRRLRLDAVLLAEVGAQLDRFLVNGRKICGVGKSVLAYLKTDMRIVCRTPGVPSAMIPRKRLVGSDAPVRQSSNEHG